MIDWIQNVLSHETKASLRKRIRDQEDTIAGLMSRPVVELAKLAWERSQAVGIDEFDKRCLAVTHYIIAHADELRCLAMTEDEADVQEAEARLAKGDKPLPYRYLKGDEDGAV